MPTYPIMIFGRLRSVQRLCQMCGLDVFTPRQVCNRARQFQDVMAKKPPHLGLSEINAFVLEKVRYGI